MMMRKLMISLGLVMLVAGMAPAQKAEPRESGFSSWFKDLQKKIETIAPRKSLTVSTGVAGVRGSKDEGGKGKLYWKGKKGDEPVTEEELNEFKEALACAEKGDTVAAMKELEEFMKQYPDSALIPDAKKGLDLLKMEAKAAPAAAPAQK